MIQKPDARHPFPVQWKSITVVYLAKPKMSGSRANAREKDLTLYLFPKREASSYIVWEINMPELGKQQTIFKGEKSHLSYWSICFYGHLILDYCCVCAQIVSEVFSNLESTMNSFPFPSAQAHAGVILLHKAYLPAIRGLSLPGIGGNERINPEHASGGSVTLHSSQWPLSCCSLHGQLQPLH